MVLFPIAAVYRDSTRPMWFHRSARHSSGTGTRMRTAYAASLLGGMRTDIRTRFTSPGLDAATSRACQAETDAAVKAIITVRPSQPLLDCLVRGTTRLFVPHFTDGDAERNRDHHRNRDRTEARGTRVQRATHRQSGHADPRARRWSVRSKAASTLDDRLWYVLYRADHHAYEGALLNYTVSTKRPNDHANLIYVAYRPLRCVLIEPNGPVSTTTYPDGVRRLRAAWVKVAPVTADKVVHVLGEDRSAHPNALEVSRNLHSLVGRRTSTTTTTQGRRVRRIQRAGYGVCGAVTMWIVRTWVRSSRSDTLEEHYARMCRDAQADPARAKHGLERFLTSVGDWVKNHYETALKAAIHTDLKRLQNRLRREKVARGPFEARVRLRVQTTDGETIYAHTHTVRA